MQYPDHSQSPKRRNQSRRRDRRALGAAALCGLLAGACINPPDRDERGMLAGARRVLALDFSSRAATRRADELTRWQRWFGAELRRTPDAVPAGIGKELRRPGALLDTGHRIARNDLKRRPRNLLLWLPEPAEFARDVAEDLDRAAWLLGAFHHPLGEIDDRRHRTRHDDDRPEATLWQRLRRRLRL